MSDERKGLQRIPPFSAKETLDFYATGAIPERFRDVGYMRSLEIIRRHNNPNAEVFYENNTNDCI